MEHNTLDRRTPEQPRAAGSPVIEEKQQTEHFEKAIALFHAGQFEAAKALFRDVEGGPARELAHSARLHARMCERRLAQSQPAFRTTEDRYNYAIALINERRVEAAEAHLKEAVSQLPDGDHLYYALALCRGLSGDLDGAYRHLKKALELQPRNKALARNDPDFAEIAQRPPLRDLLYPQS